MVSIIIAGDYSPKDRVAKLIETGKTDEIFTDIKKILNQSDYAIVNFESAVISERSKLIKKNGPGMHCTHKAVELLKRIGFDAVSLANNHFRDYGDEGVNNSLIAFEKNHLDYFGGGRNIEEAERTFYKELYGRNIAFINVCEHEFSIASTMKSGSAPMDIIDVSHRIVSAKKQADFVVVIVHGGNEHYQLPSSRLKKTYRFFIEMGADAIVNHHQHCYSGYEVYNRKPIFYGLGNFCFDWESRNNLIWNEGYLLKLILDEAVGFELIPYVQCKEKPTVTLMQGEERLAFERKIAELNQIIADDELLNREYDRFCQRRKRAIIAPFTAYLTPFARVAAGRRLLPYLIPKGKMAELINFIECESHRDVLLKVLHEKFE